MHIDVIHIAARRATSGGSRRQSILLVEDNKDAGDSALRCALDVTPDFVICDLGLPGAMDGYAVPRAFRTEPGFRSVRLIAASGYSGHEYSTKAMAAGFECLLTKPFNFDVLESLVMSKRAAD